MNIISLYRKFKTKAPRKERQSRAKLMPIKKCFSFLMVVLFVFSVFNVFLARETKAVECADWDTVELKNGTFKKAYELTPNDAVVKCVYGSESAIKASGGSTSNNISIGAVPDKAIDFIQFALGFLSLVAVMMILYGGFTWMTSSGSENQVTRAKKILYAAIIGLVITTSAWAIVSFVIKTGNETLVG